MTDQPGLRAVALSVLARHLPRRLLLWHRCQACGRRWPCRTRQAALDELAGPPLRIGAPWTREAS